MNEELFPFILKTQKIEYAIFNSKFLLKEKSKNLAEFFEGNRSVELGTNLYDLFFELIGFEETLNKVLNGKKDSIGIDWIGDTQSPNNSAENSRHINYYNLKVFPFKRGLLVILRNVSEEGNLEQTVYRRLNELDLLSIQLIEDLKFTNRELNTAYKTTIEGWARALELRDVETKGHSVRVVGYTILLAIAMGVLDEELDKYYYGALLHDIGKMGIPDRILLKKTALDPEEWAIMRLHPIYANRLLSSIKYPRFSLDIPTYHHEQWNGKGYPYGLKETEIPLAARVFSIVDVYDALINDRPYRKAWTVEKAIEYISGKSGVCFDPDVIEKFLELISHGFNLSDLPEKYSL